jgi:hypothetical protein
MYTSEIRAMAAGSQRTEDQVVESLRGVVLESLNEKIPTHNYDQTMHAVGFDVAFCEALQARYGGALVPGVLTAAIGNPHESEVEWLLPAAQAATECGGFLGYHAYWTANESRSFLEEHWRIHAGRWTHWDEVFTARGVFPRYYFGEGGIVYANDGVSFNSGRGWKSCGDIDRYIADMDMFNARLREWNAAHGNRGYGITLFGYGNWGWDDFEIGAGDLLLMQAQAITDWLV